MGLSKNEQILLGFQIAVFSLSRLMDDLSWYEVGVHNQGNIFQGIGVAGLAICVVLQILRKKTIQGWFKILFFHSQLKFLIPWSLIITIDILFFSIFGCQTHVPEGETHNYYL